MILPFIPLTQRLRWKINGQPGGKNGSRSLGFLPASLQSLFGFRVLLVQRLELTSSTGRLPPRLPSCLHTSAGPKVSAVTSQQLPSLSFFVVLPFVMHFVIQVLKLCSSLKVPYYYYYFSSWISVKQLGFLGQPIEIFEETTSLALCLQPPHTTWSFNLALLGLPHFLEETKTIRSQRAEPTSFRGCGH